MDYEHKADSDLLLLLKQDDRAAFNAIYRRHWERLYAIAFSRLQHIHAAEDIVQEVFISLWQNRLSTNIAILENYLATAIMYQTFKYLDKNRRVKMVQHDQMPELVTEITAIQILDNKNMRQLIEDETNKLPEQCRLIFRKSREEHKTIQEIADELKISPSTVNNQLTKALGRLRKSLKTILFFIPLP